MLFPSWSLAGMEPPPPPTLRPRKADEARSQVWALVRPQHHTFPPMSARLGASQSRQLSPRGDEEGAEGEGEAGDGEACRSDEEKVHGVPLAHVGDLRGQSDAPAYFRCFSAEKLLTLAFSISCVDIFHPQGPYVRARPEVTPMHSDACHSINCQTGA